MCLYICHKGNLLLHELQGDWLNQDNLQNFSCIADSEKVMLNAHQNLNQITNRSHMDLHRLDYLHYETENVFVYVYPDYAGLLKAFRMFHRDTIFVLFQQEV